MDVCAMDAQHAPFAIVLTNPDPAGAVQVTIGDVLGHSHALTLAGGDVVAVRPQELGFADHSIDHSGISASVYRVVSSRPIIAYQLNPQDDVGVFSNDGSLLLPVATLGKEYVGVTYPTFSISGGATWNGYLAVAAPAGPTQVIVKPTAAVRAGDGVPAIAAGEVATFTLAAGEVLNLEAGAAGDLTGTAIAADGPVAVFGGHEATVIANPFPFTGPCCADHLESQLLPARSWGTMHAIGWSRESGPYRDYLRVVAREPGTTVHIEPMDQNCFLDAGEFCEAFFDTDGVEVQSTRPVQVAHFLVSGGGISPVTGDPDIEVVPPIDQFRASYAVLVPEQFEVNYLAIVGPAGAPVAVDGNDVTTAVEAFASGTYGRVLVPVDAGRHTITCPQTCSVEVMGMGNAVSYLYAGGMDVRDLVE
jgi:hypothetical protein